MPTIQGALTLMTRKSARGQRANAVVGALARADIRDLLDEVRRGLRIEAADVDGVAHAGVTHQREESRHALGVDAVPVRRVVKPARRVPDVVARGKYERLEPRKLGARQTAGEVIAGQELERGHAGAGGRRLARGDRDLVSKRAKTQRRVAADQSRPADDEHSHAVSLVLASRTVGAGPIQ